MTLIHEQLSRTADDLVHACTTGWSEKSIRAAQIHFAVLVNSYAERHTRQPAGKMSFAVPFDATDPDNEWSVDLGTSVAGLNVGAYVKRALIDWNEDSVWVWVDLITPFSASLAPRRLELGEFASLCRAIGMRTVAHVDAVTDRPFVATLGLDGQISRFWFPDEGNVPDVPLPGLAKAA